MNFYATHLDCLFSWSTAAAKGYTAKRFEMFMLQKKGICGGVVHIYLRFLNALRWVYCYCYCCCCWWWWWCC